MRERERERGTGDKSQGQWQRFAFSLRTVPPGHRLSLRARPLTRISLDDLQLSAPVRCTTEGKQNFAYATVVGWNLHYLQEQCAAADFVGAFLKIRSVSVPK